MLTKLHSGKMILLSNRVVGRETFVVRQNEFFCCFFFVLSSWFLGHVS